MINVLIKSSNVVCAVSDAHAANINGRNDDVRTTSSLAPTSTSIHITLVKLPLKRVFGEAECNVNTKANKWECGRMRDSALVCIPWSWALTQSVAHRPVKSGSGRSQAHEMGRWSITAAIERDVRGRPASMGERNG